MEPRFWHIASIYAFLYAGGGFVGIFLPLLFQDIGFSQLQIGLIAATAPIAAMVGAPVLGALSDWARRRRKAIIVTSLLTSWTLYLTLPFVGLYCSVDDAFAVSISAIALASAIGVASGSLLDAIAVESVKQNECVLLFLGFCPGVNGVVLNFLGMDGLGYLARWDMV